MTTIQRIIPGVVEQPHVNVPINHHAVSTSALKVPPEKRTYVQKVGAMTYGQLFGGIVSVVSIGKCCLILTLKKKDLL